MSELLRPSLDPHTRRQFKPSRLTTPKCAC